MFAISQKWFQQKLPRNNFEQNVIGYSNAREVDDAKDIGHSDEMEM